jgi:hypothetical protein
MHMPRLLGAVSACSISLGLVTSIDAAPVPDPNQVFSGTYVDMYLKNLPDALSEQQIFLDAATASTITGHVGSQTGTPLVIFSSETDTLIGANGFANIKAQDNYLNNITITAPGYWFEDLIFSVNLSLANTDLSVTAKDKSGATEVYSGWAGDAGWVSGENRILVLATSGNLMQSVTIDSLIGFESLGGLDSLKQTEISGLTAVPVPAAIWLFGSGLLGMAVVARRKMTS